MSKKTSKKPAATKAKPAPVVKATGTEKRNGVAQPKDGSLCRKVWDALDKLIEDGKNTTFEAVRELAGKEMADATIRTQRQRHKTFHAKA